MNTLTKAEEEIMQVIWRIGPSTVGQIREELEKNTGDLPAHSTISTMLRILVEKGFLTYKAYGRTFEYTPTISKEDYSRRTLNKLVSDYFEGSMNRLVSFLLEKKELDMKELNNLLDKLEDDK
ncbi:MAG: BlaI/MecI/CopY family transcriptional regulator [Saprospiraceae bacterium]